MLDNILSTQIPPEWITLGKKLLKDFGDKNISSEEFDKECAYFAYNCGFSELELQPYPAKPVKLLELESMGSFERKKIGEKFWERDDIKAYIRHWKKVTCHNSSTRHWLKKLYQTFTKEGDYKRAEECKAKFGEGRIDEGV